MAVGSMAVDRPSFRRTSGVRRWTIIKLPARNVPAVAPQPDVVVQTVDRNLFVMICPDACTSTHTRTRTSTRADARAPAPNGSSRTSTVKFPVLRGASASSHAENGPAHRIVDHGRPTTTSRLGGGRGRRRSTRASRVERWVSGHEPTKNTRSYASTRARRAAGVCSATTPRTARFVKKGRFS